jgi:elongation factor P
MILVNDIHKGVVLKLEGQLHLVVEFQHVNPGKGGGFVRTKLKNIFTQGVTEKTFRSGDKLEDAEIDARKATYQYHDADTYNFMDSQNYEQYTLSADDVGDSKNYLKENMEVEIELYESRPISLLLPNFVTLKITQSDPGVRGDTVSGALKPATLETGVVVMVPLFVSQGEVIKVDTRTGTYIERVGK